MNLKGKKKSILLLALLLVLLVCGGIYTAYRLHPENFAGKNDIITSRGICRGAGKGA